MNERLNDALLREAHGAVHGRERALEATLREAVTGTHPERLASKAETSESGGVTFLFDGLEVSVPRDFVRTVALEAEALGMDDSRKLVQTALEEEAVSAISSYIQRRKEENSGETQ